MTALAISSVLFTCYANSASLRAKGMGEAFTSIAGGTGSWQYNPAGIKSKMLDDNFSLEFSIEQAELVDKKQQVSGLTESSIDFMLETDRVAVAFNSAAEEIQTFNVDTNGQMSTTDIHDFGFNLAIDITDGHYLGFGLLGYSRFDEKERDISGSELNYSIGYQKRWQSQFATSSHTSALIEGAIGASYFSAADSADRSSGMTTTPERTQFGANIAIIHVTKSNMYQKITFSGDLERKGEAFDLIREPFNLYKGGVELQLVGSSGLAVTLRGGVQLPDNKDNKTLMAYGGTISYGNHHVDLAYWQPVFGVQDGYKAGIGYTWRSTRD
jgi:hypothetical protein